MEYPYIPFFTIYTINKLRPDIFANEHPGDWIIFTPTPIKYSPNGIFTNKYYFTCLLHFLDSHVYWRQYKGFPGFSMLGKPLDAAHMIYISDGVYDAINNRLL